jgi:hypothetical protein
VLSELETDRLLLKTDAKLPNVCALVAGGPIHGSWWAHPMSHRIFRVINEVASHSDILMAKLISGKDTFVHRDIWPAFLAVAMSRERWQFATLDTNARALLKRADKQGTIEASGIAATALEKALLVHGEPVHTAEGSHAKVLTSWRNWMERRAIPTPELTAAEGREAIEKVVSYLNRRYGGRGRLPW